VGRQADDLRWDRSALTLEQIASVHRRKTGALCRFSVCGAAEHAGAPTATRTALEQFASAYGAAFQISDDLQDGAGERSEMSVLRVVSAERAQQLAREEIDRAIAALEPLGEGCAQLRVLALLVSERLGTL